LRKRQVEFNEQADQDAKNLNESAASWKARYASLFNDFSKAIAEISPKEIESLCLALSAKMNPPVQSVQ
jgi:hypothetical protein